MLENLPKLIKNQSGQARLQSLARSNSGQALLIIVLIMVVALTIGLSVASRTITNVRTTTQQINSQKALSAAEAGIERAIKSNASIAETNVSGNTSFNTTIGDVLGDRILLNGGSAVSKSDGVYIWLSPYTTVVPNPWTTWPNGSLTIHWGDATDPCNNAAIEVSVIRGPGNNPSMSRYGFDPCAARASGNRFTPVSSSITTISGVTFYYSARIPPAGNLTQGLLVRVNPIYKNAFIGAIGTTPSGGANAFPSQGKIITSVGTSDTNTKRKITVFQSYPEVPTEFFPYTLFRP